MIKVLPSRISGKIRINPSKSITQRCYAIASLCKEQSTIKNPSMSNDSLASLNIVKRMGSEVIVQQDKVKIAGMKKECENFFNCRESGLCFRMFAPILSLFGKEIVLTGEGSLLKRPVAMIDRLSDLGVKVETSNGFPPIKLRGKLSGGTIKIDAGITSQFLTGLLIALSVADKKSEIFAENTVSRPYIDLTIDLLKKVGVAISNENYSKFLIQPTVLSPLNIEVEGDFSSACFILVAGAIAGKVEAEGLNPASKQADKKILDILLQAGCQLKIENGTITAEESELSGFTVDVKDCPDIVPSLVPLASKACSPSKIFGVSRLKYKESDRLYAMMKEFEKIGVKSEIQTDCLTIFPSKVQGGIANSNNDHRVAMALALCGIISENGVSIENEKCVEKSYPEFFKHIEKLNAKLEKGE